MSDLFEGLFDLMGEAAGAVAEIAEGAGALFEGTTTVASAIAEGAGPALAGAARGVGHIAGAAINYLIIKLFSRYFFEGFNHLEY